MCRDKAAQLQNIYARIKETAPDKDYVFGSGAPNSPVVLIGEAPGAREVRCGRPFCGKAGCNLTGFLSGAGIDREHLFITNAVKYRPVKISAKGTVSNRAPNKAEILDAAPFLHEEIAVLNPRLIVTLGNTPLKAVTGDFKLNVGSVHGNISQVITGGKQYNLFPLFHPAAVIYNPALSADYKEDLLKLKEYLEKVGIK